jgi:hypothetical protein
MLLTERYKEQITGVISCYDRLVIQDTLPGWCFAGGMTSFLNANKIRIFDYPQFANALREEIRSHAEAIARENDLEMEHHAGRIRNRYCLQETGRSRTAL